MFFDHHCFVISLPLQPFPISCWELTRQLATSIEDEAHEDLWVGSGHIPADETEPAGC